MVIHFLLSFNNNIGPKCISIVNAHILVCNKNESYQLRMNMPGTVGAFGILIHITYPSNVNISKNRVKEMNTFIQNKAFN